MSLNVSPRFVHLRQPGVSVVVNVDSGVPVIEYWGKELESVSDEDFLALASRPRQPGGVDVTAPIAVVPQHSDGCFARPGLAGHRPGGRHFAPRFLTATTETSNNFLRTISNDPAAELNLSCEIALRDSGVLALRAIVTNVGQTRYLLDTLTITLPVPTQAQELITLTGKWANEFEMHRQDFNHGAWTAENRTGRTSHEHPPVVWATQSGASEWSGEVWGAHLAWSGNHVLLAEVLTDGRKYLQLGELQMAGELCLEPQGSYSTPEVVATYSPGGLTPASWNLHRNVRQNLPRRNESSSRKVLLNTWEAVYFEHNEDKLKDLANLAAQVGIERFVLDDGWFSSRRSDKSSLGDWWVSPEIYPNGLSPLITHVRALGMDFGIWVEPEMANPDSELFRMHPDWVLASPDYVPVTGRNQLVLNLNHQPAYQFIFAQLDKLLTENEISFIKWDMNRPHVQATLHSGAAGTHEQTLAVYRLIDQLRAKHPKVEIESCASGGGRIDHEILRRTDRVWTSDCNDALDRQRIQRGASMFIPNEVMGAHIGSNKAHTTGRRHSWQFRGATAFFGSLGVELDISRLKDFERAALTKIIALHKQHRQLLHSGNTVRFDRATKTQISHGVYALDLSEAIVSFAQLPNDDLTLTDLESEPLRMPGLLAERKYQISVINLADSDSQSVGDLTSASTFTANGKPLEYSGEQLANEGLPMPVLIPESAILLHLKCV